MKAVVYERYGPPEVLHVRDIPKPTPKKDEILVKVICTSVTAADWRVRKADPFLVRVVFGFFKPTKSQTLGLELAGIVEDVGKNVQSFKRGDAVFAMCGFNFGAYAEYKCLKENNLVALKPTNMTFEEAATSPIGGVTALRFLKQAGLKSGQSILVYGASGSVGTFAVQVAKHFGAEVTGVCSTRNLELVRALGASKVIDYTKEDFKNIGKQFDVVFDAVGKIRKADCKGLLKEEGKFISAGSTTKKNQDDLLVLKEIIESGSVKSVIDKTYTLEEIREAHKYVETFRKKGNVVVKVASV